MKVILRDPTPMEMNLVKNVSVSTRVAGKALGLSRTTIYLWRKRFGIKPVKRGGDMKYAGYAYPKTIYPFNLTPEQVKRLSQKLKVNK